MPEKDFEKARDSAVAKIKFFSDAPVKDGHFDQEFKGFGVQQQLDPQDKAAMLQFNFNTLVGSEWENVDIESLAGSITGVIPEGFGSLAAVVTDE